MYQKEYFQTTWVKQHYGKDLNYLKGLSFPQSYWDVLIMALRSMQLLFNK